MIELARRCRSLLVPVRCTVDGDRFRLASEQRFAVGTALRIACAFDGTVTIACIYPGDVHGAGPRQALDLWCERWLADLQRRGMRTDVICQTELLRGAPWEQIVTCAGRRGHDLIVMGTNPGSETSALVGITATRVLRTCPVSVLVARRGSLDKRSVLVATDLTVAAGQVIRLGLQVAKWRQGDLHLVHASAAGAGLPKLRAELEIRLAREVGHVGFPSAIVTHVHRGGVGDVIWECATRERVGLVIMGMFGRAGAARLLSRTTGGTAPEGLPCPLLTVPCV